MFCILDSVCVYVVCSRSAYNRVCDAILDIFVGLLWLLSFASAQRDDEERNKEKAERERDFLLSRAAPQRYIDVLEDDDVFFFSSICVWLSRLWDGKKLLLTEQIHFDS